MERQNVTLSLPKPLLRKAKALATKAEKSLSELLREALEEKVNEESGYKKAKRNQLNLLKVGLDLGTEGYIKISREELHARR
ncbi:MAG: ribbon-helix-helix protein, CopG family [Syntrophales bacterium]|jgi:metal-responsive CopG/Arc/MetJ family transcriptional regulator